MRKSTVSAATLVALASLTASAPASASAPWSDTLSVYDGSGALVDFVGVTEAQEVANGADFIYTSNIAIDPNQQGNESVLVEPGTPPLQGYSDIIGVCFCGGGQHLGFASDNETALVNYGQFPRTISEAGPVDVTLYLHPALQAQGYTAWFQSFSLESTIPEPAAWTLMLVSFSGLGAAMRSRRRQVIAN